MNRDQLKYTITLCDPLPKTVTARNLAQAMFGVKKKPEKKAASPALQIPRKILE